MTLKPVSMLTVMALSAITIAGPARAQIYKWNEEGGSVSFSDDARNIPVKSRKDAQIIATPDQNKKSEEAEPQDKGGSGLAPQAVAQPAGMRSDKVINVPLKSHGFSYLVDTEVNRGTRASFLVDTGASFVIISPELAKKIGVSNMDNLPKMPVTTAGGVSWIYLIEIESLKVGEAEAVHVEAGVSSSIGEGFDGLLGMSFLNEFIHQIDGPGSKMLLKSARGAGQSFGGHDKGWWRTKYTHYSESIRRFTAYRESLVTGAPLDDPEIKKVKGFTEKDVKKIIDYYTGLLNSLDRRASAAGVPSDWRVYP